MAKNQTGRKGVYMLFGKPRVGTERFHAKSQMGQKDHIRI